MRSSFFFTIFIILGIFISAWSVIQGDIQFHVDIARDFLLVQEIVEKGDFTLIGPRAGAVQGLFHGPLWLYMHVPAFVIGDGNPVAIGWFWVFLVALTIAGIGWVGAKLFGKIPGYAAAALFATYAYDIARGLFNPFGAVMLMPFLFYYLLRYLQMQKITHLLICVFVIGLCIQFQMAFGVPILLLTFLISAHTIIRQKAWSHFLAYLILLIPLSTFILFELRNNFLQYHAIISFLQIPSDSAPHFLSRIFFHLRGILLYKQEVIRGPHTWITAILIVATSLYLFLLKRQKKLKNADAYGLMLYLYVGYWTLTLLFKGEIWSYYVWPFVPLIFIFFASLYNIIPKKLWFTCICSILLWHIFLGLQDIRNSSDYWVVNHQMAQQVFSNINEDFGYYIFTPELLGYSPRYAMDYAQKAFSHHAYPFEKKRVTYLIINPPKESNIVKNVDWWKTGEVRIATSPVTIDHIGDYVIEKYELTDEEIKTPANPNLLQGIHFR